jgi:putative endonuclease
VKNTQWFVYIIEADDGSYYTGVSTDVERRFKDHESSPRGAKYFLGRAPKAIVYLEDGHNRSSAHKREAQIKKLKRKDKEELVHGTLG